MCSAMRRCCRGMERCDATAAARPERALVAWTTASSRRTRTGPSRGPEGQATSRIAPHEYDPVGVEVRLALPARMRGVERLFPGTTPRPLTVHATPHRYGGFTVLRFASSAGRESIQVQATVDRADGQLHRHLHGDADRAQPTPGLRNTSSRMVPHPRTRLPTHRRHLARDRHASPAGRPVPRQDDPFNACYATLFTWPTIQDHDPNGDLTWFGAVPNNRFFNARAPNHGARAIQRNRPWQQSPQGAQAGRRPTRLDTRVHRRPMTHHSRLQRTWNAPRLGPDAATEREALAHRPHCSAHQNRSAAGFGALLSGRSPARMAGGGTRP